MTKEIAWAHKVYQTKDKAKSLQVFEFINNIIINSKKNAYNYLNLLDEPQKEGKGTFLSHGYLLKNILLGIRDLKTYLSLPYLTHTHKETCDRAFKILAEKFDLPKLIVSGREYNFKKTTGIGYLRDVRVFYECNGLKYEPASWIGIESKGDKK